jgi:glutathione S-transferase
MNGGRATLIIGNKNYSSWSLRPWLLMRQLGIDFEERKLPLSSDEFRREIARFSPVARVPVLVVDGFAVWDSLAIAEYLNDSHPGLGVWPADPKARARARSVCAEMHSGFSALRDAMPVNIEAKLPGLVWDLRVQADIERIAQMWSDLRSEHAANGPFLFGRFSAADAFFAPVITRFDTYGVTLSPLCEDYRQAIHQLPAMRDWIAAALAEHSFIAEDEPYRRAPQ